MPRIIIVKLNSKSKARTAINSKQKAEDLFVILYIDKPMLAATAYVGLHFESDFPAS